MPFVEKNGLRYFQFSSFPEERLVHGIFTRQGGVSPAPWSSLNLGGTVGDERANVIENRARIFSAFQRPVESVFDVWQVHSKDVVCTEQPRPLDEPHGKADAIMTDRPEITLFMRFADCVPVLLYDPGKNVIAIVHAGWQGTVQQIGAEAVRTMTERYGSQPANIFAGVGPSIGPDHYQVGSDVIARVEESFNGSAAGLFKNRSGTTYLDLWAANRLTLEQAGVRQIEVAEICTACDTASWYSHRAEYGKTGRFGALFALR